MMGVPLSESLLRLSDSVGNFFKVILPPTIKNQKLDIPVKFATEFGDELSNVATLIVPAGDGVWSVGVERSHKRIWFVDGWQKFAEHYSLTVGQFLVFSYQGNLTFHVRIYDFSCCEIEYPCVGKSMNHEEDAEDDTRGALPSSSKGKGKRKCVVGHVKRRVSVAIAKNFKQVNLKVHKIPPSQNFPTKENKYKEVFIRNLAAYTSHNSKLGIAKECQKVIHATKIFKLENPFFAVILQQRNLEVHYMFVPTVFKMKYMRGCPEYIKFEDSNENQWEIRCCISTYTNMLRIGRGCREFFKANKLKNGDVCLFELIKRKEFVLKFSVLRAAEYAIMVGNEEGNKKKSSKILDSGTLYFSTRLMNIKKSQATEKAFKAALGLKIKNDAFLVILRALNFNHKYMYVPAEFVKDHLPRCGTIFINLMASGGNKWRVRCFPDPRPRRHTRIQKGFSAFCKGNNLEVGDVCVFELMKSEAIELKVSIFRAGHYAW